MRAPIRSASSAAAAASRSQLRPSSRIGGNTENMMRYLPTNVLISNYEYQAPDLYTAEEHMTWTKEALERMR